MRPAVITAGAVVALIGVCVMVIAGGNAAGPVPATRPDVADAPALAAADPIAPVTAPSRIVAPTRAAPRPQEPGQLERVAPRKALSPLSLALPPKPKMPDEWNGTTLFRPVATAAGSVEAKGYVINIAGVEPVAPGEMCPGDGRDWPCGVAARAAFRAMLRGRAVTCKIPEQADRAVVAAPCRVGKVDVGNWLVANGWARASAGGSYAEAGKKAQADRKGVFGDGPEDAAPLPPITTGSTLVSPPVDPPEPSP